MRFKIKLKERTHVTLGALAIINFPIMIISLILTEGETFFAGCIIQLIMSIVLLAQISDHYAAQNPYSWRNQPGGTHYKPCQYD